LSPAGTKPEYDAFGIDLPQQHTDRYALAQDGSISSPESGITMALIDWNGKYLRPGYLRLSASFLTASPGDECAGLRRGRDFAARNADFLFAISIDLQQSAQEVVQIKERAAKLGRNTGVFTLCHVVPPTKEEPRLLPLLRR